MEFQDISGLTSSLGDETSVFAWVKCKYNELTRGCLSVVDESRPNSLFVSEIFETVQNLIMHFVTYCEIGGTLIISSLAMAVLQKTCITL